MILRIEVRSVLGVSSLKQLAIRRYFTSFSTQTDDMNNEVFENKMEALDKELHQLFNKYNLSLLEHDTRFIPREKMSLCYCEVCNHLMINRDKNPVRFDKDEFYNDLDLIILDGGNYKDKELCMECLPTTHRWGMFS